MIRLTLDLFIVAFFFTILFPLILEDIFAEGILQSSVLI